MSETIKSELRKTRGTRHARRLRRDGRIPAVLYGHGEPTISLSLSAEEVATTVRHGSRLVELTGAVNEKAFIRDVHWDTFSVAVAHLDLSRVADDERLQVEVPVELRGEAPGVRAGGVVEHLIHQLAIDCLAISIPDKLVVNINELQLEGSLPVSSMELPSGATALHDADATVVQCVLPQVVEEEEPTLAESAEPEVIGRKAEEEAGEEK